MDHFVYILYLLGAHQNEKENKVQRKHDPQFRLNWLLQPNDNYSCPSNVIVLPCVKAARNLCILCLFIAITDVMRNKQPKDRGSCLQFLHLQRTKKIFQGKKFSLLSYIKCCQKGSEQSSPNTSYVIVAFYETHWLWSLLNRNLIFQKAATIFKKGQTHHVIIYSHLLPFIIYVYIPT